MSKNRSGIIRLTTAIAVGSIISACLLVYNLAPQNIPLTVTPTLEYRTSTPWVIPNQHDSEPTRLPPTVIPSLTTSPSPPPTITPTIPDYLSIGDASYDEYDQLIISAIEKYQLTKDKGMVVKAMINLESKFNPYAISRWDSELPCGTHSYGLMQVTPGCRNEFAALPEDILPTAEITLGLNGIPAIISYFDEADKESGNLIVNENGLIINLVTNPENPLYPTSAFNPEYSIDTGVKALYSSIIFMKKNFDCTEKEYLVMGLSGYNKGVKSVNGCLDFSDKGKSYVDKILAEYYRLCDIAGIKPVY